MKTSRNWLQQYFASPLPEAQALADALTFHAFEIESVEQKGSDDILDVKVTPNRGHDCLCHRGIAKELSAILDVPLKKDPLRNDVSLAPKATSFTVSIEDPKRCRRFTAARIAGVKVGPSPEWLRTALEAVGQKSINNVVDATNFIMFDMGQPLHAFDAGKLKRAGGTFELAVRNANEGERMLGLDDKGYVLTPSMLVIADGSGEAVSIAGIKGGKPTGIDESTTDVILEAANWDGVAIRKTSTALKLRTDASDRFQQVISPELAPYGLRAAADLIVQIAGGTVEGFVDEYPDKQKPSSVSVSLDKINAVLGTRLSEGDVADAFTRLGLSFALSGGNFVVTVPFERLDLVISEDLIEEVARIVGYDKIPAAELVSFGAIPEVNGNFYAAEKIREDLISKGYSEVITSVFADKGERIVANKVDGVRPYLRATLLEGLVEALERNARNTALLGLQEVKLFEIGTVWCDGKETLMVGTVGDKEKASEHALQSVAASAYDVLPLSQTPRYQPFSKYPFIVRDIAMWIPESPSAFSDAIAVFSEYNRGLLRHVDLFDQYKKDARVSYAFHLVFQSFDKTLTDEEVNTVMQDIYTAVKGKGWEVR